jgi:hypothetical protein
LRVLGFDLQHTRISLTMPQKSVTQAPVDNVKSKKPPKKRVRVSNVDGDDDPQNVELVKVAKKAKRQPKPGKLADLINLPLDILFEVRPPNLPCHPVSQNISPDIWSLESFGYTSPRSHDETI